MPKLTKGADMTSTIYNSPLGPLQISENDGHITQISFMDADTRKKFQQTSVPDAECDMSPTLNACVDELSSYFAGKLTHFTVPIKLDGTPFRQRVWEALMTIPYGQTISYKELALRIDNPKAVRAVGGANHNNPISIIVPCHRVIGANGKLVGYGGGLGNKEFLLALEKSASI